MGFEPDEVDAAIAESDGTPARMAELTSAEWVDVCEIRPAVETPA